MTVSGKFLRNRFNNWWQWDWSDISRSLWSVRIRMMMSSDCWSAAHCERLNEKHRPVCWFLSVHQFLSYWLQHSSLHLGFLLYIQRIYSFWDSNAVIQSASRKILTFLSIADSQLFYFHNSELIELVMIFFIRN